MPVLDASVVVEWISPVADPDGPEIRLMHRLARAGVVLHAPHLLIQEAGNVLLTGVRRGRWTPAEADEAFGDLDRLPLVRHADNNDLERAWELSRRYDEHPIYDMVYLAIAERLDEVLVTADQRLLDRVRRPGRIVRPDDWSAES
ncbi:MAG: vapC3 [Marmoricola sp.]|nr:vapC3 [Marmoricola sp.]